MRPSAGLIERYLHPMTPIATGLSPDLSKMKPYAAMLFDVYGTLLISRAGEIGFDRAPAARMDSLRDLLRRFGLQSTPDHLAAELRRAIASVHAGARDRGIEFPEVDIVRVWQTVLNVADAGTAADFALEYELIVNPVYPMPGMADLLAACSAAGMPVGIVSNAQFYTVQLLAYFLKQSSTGWTFDERLLFFSWQSGQAKPSTAMFKGAELVLAGMRIPAAAALFVGNDMLKDIAPAASIGFATALFAGDQRSLRRRAHHDCCRKLRPDLIVTDLRQLIAGAGAI